MKKTITTLAILFIMVITTQAQTDLALTFDNPEITNDGVNDFYEVDVLASTVVAPDFKLGTGQFYLDYNPAAFGMSIGDATVDFEYSPGSILSEEFFLAIYNDANINSNTNGTVSISWEQALGAGSIAANNITAIPAVLGHLKIQMINMAEMPNICFNVSGAAFDDQFFTACGPFDPGLAIADCNGANAGIQVFDYDGSDCSGAVIAPASCSDTAVWTGTWDINPMVPTSSTSVVIQADYDTAVDGNIDACELSVVGGALVTVAPGGYIKVEGDIDVDGDSTLTVMHTGNLVQVDDAATVTNNGIINVLVVTPTLGARDFMLMGSPMSMETRAGVFAGAQSVRNHLTGSFMPHAGVVAASNGAGVWVDQEGDDWVQYNGSLNPGEGYMVMRSISGSAALSLNFNAGTLNNGVTTYSAGYNGAQESSPSIIANPYASAISADDLIDTNPGVDAVYFWEHLTAPDAGTPGPYGLNYTMEDISIYNKTGGTAAAGSGGGIPNEIISAGQGFGVKAISGSGGPVDITFNNAMRRTSGNTTLRNQDLDRVWLNVQSEGYQLNGTALIGFLDDATDGFDVGYDTKRLATNVSLYSHLDDGSKMFGIQGRGTFEENVKIPMGFATLIDENINYTISIQNIEGLHLGTATAYLIDTLEKSITNLNESNYVFTSGKGQYDGRFILQFTPEGTLGTNGVSLETVSLYPNPTQNIVTIVSPQIAVISATVYDIRGRKVSEVDFRNKNKYQIDLTSMEAAVYFIEISTEIGWVTKRIMKR